MSPRRSRRYVGTEMALGWWHCHQDVVTAIPVALGGERCLEFPPRAASQHLIFIFSSECYNILFFFFFPESLFMGNLCPEGHGHDGGCEGDTRMCLDVPMVHLLGRLWLSLGHQWPSCAQLGTPRIPWETAGGTALSPNRAHVALHCHQHA